MVKRKVKKAKTVIDPVTQDKIDKLTQLIEAFKAQAVEYENYLNSLCIQRCDKITKMYMDRLKSIPEEMKNMTITEVMKLQQKEKARETECPRDENAFRMQFERNKMTSERKRTQRKEKKRSISAPPSARNLSLSRPNLTNVAHLSRNASDLSLFTPSGKQRKMSAVVTPKFDPKRPVVNTRKPKPGEVLMSLSGSPIQNFVDEFPSYKPSDKITLSLGHGRVITFNDNVEIESDKDFLQSIDAPMKTTIQNVMEKLEKILKN